MSAPRRVTVLVGTDHHDFSRLVRWADDWQREHPEDRVLVQHGSSPAPAAAAGTELVPPTELVAVLEGADVVVTHGGPGTIMSARHAGHHPIALPRDPALGEHVDAHQRLFVEWATGRGLCQGVSSVDQLTAAVRGSSLDGTRRAAGAPPGPVVDPELIDRATAPGRRRRGPSPRAVAVLYCPEDTWALAGAPTVWGTMSLAALGDVASLWLRGREARCSCGESAVSCRFWSDVTSRAFGADDSRCLQSLRQVHRELRAELAHAARRHPGSTHRRRYLELALGYRTVCEAALAITGAAAVANNGGPLGDVLPLSHCRELDLQVLRPTSLTPGRAMFMAGLRYRGVPTVAPSDPGLRRPVRAGRAGSPIVHELQSAIPSTSGHESIAR